MQDKEVGECEFYNEGYCTCGSTLVPSEVGYADILCSDNANKNCIYKQLLQSQQDLKVNEGLVLELIEIKHSLNIQNRNLQQDLKVAVEALELKNKMVELMANDFMFYAICPKARNEKEYINNIKIKALAKLRKGE